MSSSRDTPHAAWTTFSLIGVLLPFVAMLMLGWYDLANRVRGMVSYATICLPGIVFVVSVLGEQVESGRGLGRPLAYVSLFTSGVILLIFVGISATGIIEPERSPEYKIGAICFFLLIQLVATIVAVIASARIKASLTRN